MPAKFGICALCDNVYKDEATNKVVLAGLYTGDIVVESLPADLRASMYLEVVLPDTAEHQVDLQLFVDGKHTGGAKATVATRQAKAVFGLIIPGLQLKIAAEAKLEFRASVDDQKPVSLFKKRVAVGPIFPSA